MANDSVCFLEQTDFSLRLARVAAGSQPLRLEALQEVLLTDTAALTAAVESVFAGGAGSVACALRPKPRALHLALADEAKLHPGLGGARQLATSLAGLSNLPAAWIAAVTARDGSAPANTPWIAAFAAAEGLTATQTLLDNVHVKSATRTAATLVTAGALARSVTAPLWLLEVGELGSTALLVSRDGVLAAGPVSLNLDHIAEAVQAELGLKFRGSAVKLFFNPVYDYNEVGPKIAARVAAPLKSELAALRGAHPAPIAFACAGLPAGQQWFATQLAIALELAEFSPEAKSAGLAFASPEVEAAVTPACFGFLGWIASSRAGTAAWDAEWLKLDTIALPVAPKPPAPVAAPVPVVAATPAPVAQPAPAPVPVAVAAAPAAAPKANAPVAKPATPKPAAPVPFPLPDAVIARPVAATAAAASAPAAVVAPKPAPVKAAVAPVAPAPAAPVAAKPAAAVAPVAKPAAAAPAAKPVAASSAVNYSVKPGTPEKPATPAPKKSAPPPVVVPVNTLPMAELPPSKPFFKNPVALGIVFLLLVLGVGGYFFVQSQKTARLQEEERARTEQRLQAEIAKNRAAEQRAQAETEARKKIEADAAKKVAEADAARQRAETDARAQNAARLANARGTLIVSSDPAGATVTVGNLPPRPTPATYTDLKIGKYPVSIALNLYDTAQLELEVKEDATTDSGVVKLVKILGGLELVTEPASVAYEVKPANALIVLPDARRTGRTPDTLTDLTPGDYTVTFVRDGWMPQVENVTITRDVTAHVKGMFPNGIVKITSTPAGATVLHNGTKVGVTPLTLADQTPGDVNYTLVLPDYANDVLAGRIVGGQTLELGSTLELYDHLSKLSELDQQPQVISTVEPKIPYEFRLARRSADVRVELTVTRDGSTKDLVVLPGSDRVIAPACLAAAAQWKFRPGSLHGKPANVRVIVPFNISPTE